jgi:hypothetical protein
MQNFKEGCRPVTQVPTTGTTNFETEKDITIKQQLRVKFHYNAIPLRHRFAMTYHSSQCLTLMNLLLGNASLETNVYHKMLYLGLSRASRFNDIRLTCKLDVTQLQKFRPSKRTLDIERDLVDRHEAFCSSLEAPESFRAPIQQLCGSISDSSSDSIHEDVYADDFHAVLISNIT